MSTQEFRKLHDGPGILILPNAWDAGSARLIESLGAPAIATTSAGVAWSRGYSDGDALPVEQLISVTREIARVVQVPLTVDLEGGYSNEAASVAHIAANLIDAGAVGINLEDGAGSPELLSGKIAAVRQAAEALGRDLFINIRTDVYLRGLASGPAAVDEVVRRAALYRAAGADGYFVPGLADVAGIKAVVAAIAPMPLNLMLVPGLPSIDELRSLGVRRLSAGTALASAALATASKLATGLLAGSWDGMFAEAVEYGAMNQLFAERDESDLK